MYIKSVIIDGFKSYGKRTEINGFDPEFTAITGLNGTGKSNILDSICFVLGISNLGEVRATSLQDLIFKSGQAGVTKATVTLVFDNSDPQQCPLGYEKCREISVTRQIIVGGKGKYLINGKLVKNKNISDFFCSVQLNVNNPNFLIMQGRITKVLNMKPQEVLSMIEEAAGTSLYESKREATTKLIEKKDAKVRETNTLLIEEVEPKLEKLRQERAAYIEFQKISREIEYLTRIHISYRYLKQKEAIANTENTLETLGSRIEHCKKTIVENDQEIYNLDENCKEVQRSIETEGGETLRQLEKELSDKKKEEAKCLGNIKAAQGEIDQQEKNIKAIEKSNKDDEKTLNQKIQQMQRVDKLFQGLKEADERDAKEYEAAQKKYDAFSRGLSTNEDGEALTLRDQLINAKQQISEAEICIKTSEMELRHSHNLIKKKESETQTQDAAYIKDKRLHEQLESEIKKLTAQKMAMKYQEGSFEELKDRKNQLDQEMRKVKQLLDRGNAYRYELQYRDPEPNFDRRKVHGMVGKLLTVPDNSYNLALMMSAGGSLYSYVTDDDVTCKKILQKGQLQHRVTIIPINKISSRPIDPRVVAFAQELVGPQNVNSALNVIEYDRYYDPVMKFVFGHTLICKDLNVAKQVAYHPQIMCRSVTLEGDVVDPEGTLSGGSKPKGSNILVELAEIKKLENEILKHKNDLRYIEQQLAATENVARSYGSLRDRIELREAELKACAQRLAQTTFQQHQEDIRRLKEKVSTLERDLSAAHETLNTASAKVRDIEGKLADAEGHRERESKAIMEAMQTAKARWDKSRSNWKKHEQEYETLQLEIDELKKSIDVSREQREEMLKNLDKLKTDLDGIRTGILDITDVVAEIKGKIKEQKDIINMKNKEFRELCVKKDQISKNNQELTLEIKKKENEATKLRNENKELFNKIEALENKYGWIKEDRNFFGTKNTRYDYSVENPESAGHKLVKMQEKKVKMERHINLKAMMLLDREEEQYQETMRRKKIVEEDKRKIQHIICKMDEKKREQINKAWKEVDTNFGSIFSALLPGAQARLNPVTQNNALIGLEIKIAFNGVWKESLGELSGGQRSLVALSLVLAMLKFSPAPLYILDEVDAALDMSHTQNIGKMLKQHFTSSQFIIVSLKDGMFNNANVLFRTKFEEGFSVVTRTVNKNATSANR